MKQVVYQIGKTGEQSLYDIEYPVIEVNNTVVDLKSSTLDKGWTRPGETLVHLHDDGNGVDVKTENNQFRVDYAELEYLRLALHALAATGNGYNDNLNKFVKFSKEDAEKLSKSY